MIIEERPIQRAVQEILVVTVQETRGTNTRGYDGILSERQKARRVR